MAWFILVFPWIVIETCPRRCQTWPTPARGWSIPSPNLSEHVPNPVKRSPALVEHSLKSAETGTDIRSHPYRLWPMPAKRSRVRPKVRRMRLRSHAQVWPKPTEFGRDNFKIGRAQRKLRRLQPNIGRIRLDLFEPCPTLVASMLHLAEASQVWPHAARPEVRTSVWRLRG